MDEERREEKDFGADVLCGANSYNEKYYFNEKFANLPQAVKDPAGPSRAFPRLET